MKQLRSITFPEALRDVRLRPRGAPSTAEGAEVIRKREEQAYERGLVDGERRLGEQLLQQRTELQRLQAGVLESLRSAIGQVVRDTETVLMDLTWEIATKLVDGIPIDRELVEGNVRSALAAVTEAAEIQVHLHPEDLELLQKNTSDLLIESAGARSTKFVADPTVGRGGSLVRTEFGIIDARRETRRERLRQALQS